MKKLLLALSALVAAMFAPTINAMLSRRSTAAPAPTEVARLEQQLKAAKAAHLATTAKAKADALAAREAHRVACAKAKLEGKSAPAAPAGMGADMPESMRALHEGLDEYRDSTEAAEGERVDRAHTGRSVGDVFSNIVATVGKVVQTTARPWIRGRARAAAAYGVSEGISMAGKAAGFDIKGDVRGEQNMPRQFVTPFHDLLNAFADPQEETLDAPAGAAYILNEKKMSDAFQKEFDVTNVKSILQKLVTEISIARVSYEVAIKAVRKAAFGSDARADQEGKTADAVRAQIEIYEEFVGSFSDYVSKLNPTEKAIYNTAKAVYETHIKDKVRREVISTAIMRGGKAGEALAEKVGLPVGLTGWAAKEVTRELVEDLPAIAAEELCNYGEDFLDELLATLGADATSVSAPRGPAARSAHGGAGAGRAVTLAAPKDKVDADFNAAVTPDGNLHFKFGNDKYVVTCRSSLAAAIKKMYATDIFIRGTKDGVAWQEGNCLIWNRGYEAFEARYATTLARYKA